MAVVQAEGARLHVVERGAGTPIVFVHEYCADVRDWEEQLRHFSRSHRAIAYNARGYPPSDVPDDPGLYGWEFASEDIGAVMDGLAIERAHIVGLSQGGYAALMFGLRHPGRCLSITAAGAGSGSGRGDGASWVESYRAHARDIAEHGMTAFAPRMAESPTRLTLKAKDPLAWAAFVERLSSHSDLGMANTMARFQLLRPSLYDFRDQFATLSVPVLLAVGDEDAPVIETNLMLKQALPNAGLWVFPNTGHVVNLEEPEAFNATVGAFVTAVEQGAWRRGR